jgi:two-component system LytT family response regulator
MIRALLIDDEKTARTDMRAMLAAHPEIEIVGEAATVKSARALLADADYALVFLDIQIIGGSGFDLVPNVKAGAKIIFVTAFNEHAVRAFEVNALDYLLKPVKAERLASALTRVELPSTPETDVPAHPAGLSLRLDDILQLHSGSSARFAAVSDLAAIESQENYSLVYLVDATTVLVRRSLKAWEDMLPAAQFLRVHRTTIVNLTRLSGYRRDAQKSVSLQIQGVSTPVPVGRLYWPVLRERLPNIEVAIGD